MSDNLTGKKRICPLKAQGDLCCGDLCEWYIENSKHLKGKGICAVTLTGFGSLLIEEIEKKLERDL